MSATAAVASGAPRPKSPARSPPTSRQSQSRACVRWRRCRPRRLGACARPSRRTTPTLHSTSTPAARRPAARSAARPRRPGAGCRWAKSCRHSAPRAPPLESRRRPIRAASARRPAARAGGEGAARAAPTLPCSRPPRRRPRGRARGERRARARSAPTAPPDSGTRHARREAGAPAAGSPESPPLPPACRRTALPAPPRPPPLAPPPAPPRRRPRAARRQMESPCRTRRGRWRLLHRHGSETRPRPSLSWAARCRRD
mmetsp:Transcript_21389/g.70687  ORF Transcript_21389/g.70687 Transcript_21389/m.70687 type:complete len:257 (-) Transcript_21389:483-1253(-)